MRKVVIHKAGDYKQLKIEEAPELRPKDNEVVVTTKAIGINYADIIIRWACMNRPSNSWAGPSRRALSLLEW